MYYTLAINKLLNDWELRISLAKKSRERCRLSPISPNVSAQSRAFISGRSKRVHGMVT